MASSTSTAMRAAAPVRRRPARRPRRRRGRQDSWWPVVLVAALVVLGVAWARSADDVPAEGSCTVDGGTVTISAEQARNATTIAQVARDRGLPDRAVVIALATAQQESGLRNLDYGDRDSLGLFQQRPSQGWGTPAQVQDPVYAAGIFYDRLVQVPNWESRSVVDASDRVQRSAYPERVGQWEPMAQELTAALRDNTLTCT